MRILVVGTGGVGSAFASITQRRTFFERCALAWWSMREYGSQAVVWQTAINPVIALERLATGAWRCVGVLGPEACPSHQFLEKLAEYGSPHGVPRARAIVSDTPRTAIWRAVPIGTTVHA